MGDRGAIRNITTDNLTVGSLFRAAFDHMADNYAHCASRLSPERAWDRVVLSGGLARNVPYLRERIASRFACPLRLHGTEEETLQGLLVLAAETRG